MAKTSGSGKQVRMVKKANWLKIILIFAVFVVIGFYGKIYNVMGKMTGEVSSDGRPFADLQEVADYKCDSKEIELETGDKVLIPDIDVLEFTSEDQIQDLPFGNAPENEGYYVACVFTIQDHVLLDSALYKPGQAAGKTDLLAYFKPDDKYTGTIKYIFYDSTQKRIKTIGEYEEEIPIEVTGSSYYYDNQIGKYDNIDDKEEREQAKEEELQEDKQK